MTARVVTGDHELPQALIVKVTWRCDPGKTFDADRAPAATRCGPPGRLPSRLPQRLREAGSIGRQGDGRETGSGCRCGGCGYCRVGESAPDTWSSHASAADRPTTPDRLVVDRGARGRWTAASAYARSVQRGTRVRWNLSSRVLAGPVCSGVLLGADI